MKDYTTLVIEAQDARSRMQEAKKRIKAEVRRKYEAAIARDVAEGTLEAEVEFARTLARVHAAGVSQAILRREVLRTNVWGEWTRWRDLAGIEPERVTARDAKKEQEIANRAYRWEEDDASNVGWTLVLLRDPNGEEMPELRVDFIKVTDAGLNAIPENTQYNSDLAKKYFNGDLHEVRKYASQIATKTRKEIGL